MDAGDSMVGNILSLAIKTLLIVYLIYCSPRIIKWFKVTYLTIGRDLTALMRLFKTKYVLYKMRQRDATVPKIFRENAERHPDKIAIHFEDEAWTFRQLDEYSNRIANLFLEAGYQQGNEIALFMETRPEYVGIWLGAAKAGLVTALINTNLRGDTLIHSITCVESRGLIYGQEMATFAEDVLVNLAAKRPSLEFYHFGDEARTVHGYEVKPLRKLTSEVSADLSVSKFRGCFTDKLFYVYTSGTTGLPKAAIIKHCRYLFFGTGCNMLVGLGHNQTIYTSIPLYHLAGGAIGTCQMLVFGNTLAIRAKFSASRFWTDCIKYNATAAQYIGEICRYVLTQPESQNDRNHQVKICFGNGMRPNIWREFKERFNIERICEFYGATEGNANVVNVTGKEGACGFVSQILPIPLLNLFYPVSIIRVNEETGEAIRDANGLCIPCGPGESGEFVGKIIEQDPTRAFDGYANKDASEKKIIRDVFKKGDAAFASGDLLTIDDLGFVYFKDRTGDTYRWKGENVSTTEVESVVSNQVQLSDCVVYGVTVPGCEGKAGMAAIEDPNQQVNLVDLLNKLRRALPSYAIPVFVRLVKKIETTGTFKLPKVFFESDILNHILI